MEKITIRQKLLKAIYTYSHDELENDNDWYTIAMENEEQLIDRIIHILNYYYAQANED